MANDEQLSILKQGVQVWNKWRENNPHIPIDLIGADLIAEHLRGADLRRVNLSGARLFGADLSRADLSLAYLSGANLGSANLSEANLCEVYLRGAYLRGAYLREAYLSEARLFGADLIRADLSGASLSAAYLVRANLSGANLSGAKIYGAMLSSSIFSNVDLSNTEGLADTYPLGPSTVGTDTLAKSRGQIPEAFLLGCGLSDKEIEQAKLYNPDLRNEEINAILYKIYDLRDTQALQISSLFISYSHDNSAFVDRLERNLKEKGIRFWRDIHDMTAGKIERQIDLAIRQNPTVVLVLSKSAQKSDWVELEVRTARELEKEMGRDVLCPVTLDDSWKSSSWPKRIRDQIMEYNILDFSEWKDDLKFEGMFRKLIDGLELFYKG